MSRLLALALFVGCSASQSGAAAPTTPAPATPTPAPAAPVASSGSSDLADTLTVATWDGGSVTYGSVREKVNIELLKTESEMLMQLYDTRAQELEQQVADQLVTAEAKKRGLAGPEALLKVEVEDKTAAPTEPEIQEAYAQLARRLGGRPLEEVRENVAKAVTQKKQAERYAAFVEELKKSYNVKISLPFPQLPRFPVTADDDPVEGSKDAPVTIIQFAEYQCPYCGRANETVNQLLKDYDGKVKFVFRDFPLGFHDRAIPVAIAANCAGQQGKYWEVHDRIMTNQRALSDADLDRIAQEVGLNTSDWAVCRKDPTIEAEIRKDMEAGSALGVEGTPAFFVNGMFLNGAQPYDRFSTLIDAELGKKG